MLELYKLADHSLVSTSGRSICSKIGSLFGYTEENIACTITVQDTTVTTIQWHPMTIQDGSLSQAPEYQRQQSTIHN